MTAATHYSNLTCFLFQDSKVSGGTCLLHFWMTPAGPSLKREEHWGYWSFCSRHPECWRIILLLCCGWTLSQSYPCTPLFQTQHWCHDLCIHSQTRSHIGRPNLQPAHGARPSTCSLPSACTAHYKLPSSSHFLWFLHFSAVECSDWCWDTCWDIFSHCYLWNKPTLV